MNPEDSIINRYKITLLECLPKISITNSNIKENIMYNIETKLIFNGAPTIILDIASK